MQFEFVSMIACPRRSWDQQGKTCLMLISRGASGSSMNAMCYTSTITLMSQAEVTILMRWCLDARGCMARPLPRQRVVTA